MKTTFPAAATVLISLAYLLATGGNASAATAVPNPPMPEKSALVLSLENAVAGLEMPSETDAPFQVVFFPFPVAEAQNADAQIADPPLEKAPQTVPITAPNPATKPDEAPLTPAQIAQLVGAPADAKLETRDLDEFFEAATAVEDWMNADEKATAARFAALLQLLKTELKGAQVVVWGEAEKTVAVIGKCEGGAAGVTTLIVET